MTLHADDFTVNFLSALEYRHNFLLSSHVPTDDAQVTCRVQKMKSAVWNQFLRVELQKRAGTKDSLLLLYQSSEDKNSAVDVVERNSSNLCDANDLSHFKLMSCTTAMLHLFLMLWEVSCFVVCDHRTMFEQFTGSEEYILMNLFLSNLSTDDVVPSPSGVPSFPVEMQVRVAERVNGWLRQEGVKDMRKTLHLILKRLSEGETKDVQSIRQSMIQEVCNEMLVLLYDFTIKCVSYHGKPGDPLLNRYRSMHSKNNGSHRDKIIKSVVLPGYPLIRIKECSLAPITLKSSLVDDREQEMNEVRSGHITALKQDHNDEVVEGSLMLASPASIVAHSKDCISSLLPINSILLPPFSELLRVPRNELFHIHTAEMFSPWMRQLMVPPVVIGFKKDDGTVLPQLCSLIEDEETRLILTFIYESKRQEVEHLVWKIMCDVLETRIVAERINDGKHIDEFRSVFKSPSSHWELLLQRIPVAYPTVPTFWSVDETVHLLGTNLLDEVMTKKARLTEFTTSVLGAVWAAFGLEIPCRDCDVTDDLEDQKCRDNHIINILNKGVTKSINDNVENNDLIKFHKELLSVLFPAVSDFFSIQSVFSFSPSSVLWALIHCIFTDDTIHWARATFDSRAFNLNVDGEVLLVLSPVADMINHCSDRTDVLVRRIDEAGDFVMESAGVVSREEESADGEELMMGYGPLQNWELLLSYGFGISTTVLERGNGIPQFLLETMDCPSTQMQPRLNALREFLYIGNQYDRLPIPIDLSDQDDDSGSLDTIYAAKRRMIIEDHGLNVGNDVWLGPSCDDSFVVLPISHSVDSDPTGHIGMTGGYEWDLSEEQWTYLSTVTLSPAMASVGATNIAELLLEERRHRRRILLRPSPAVLAILHISHAQIEEYELLEKDPFTPFTSPCSATEKTSVETLRDVLCATLLAFGDSDLTVEAIVAKLIISNSNNVSVNDSNPSDNKKNEFDTDEAEIDDESAQEAIISPFQSLNERLAVECIRLPLIAMIWASLRWCCYTLVKDCGRDYNGEDDVAEVYFNRLYHQHFGHEESEANDSCEDNEI